MNILVVDDEPIIVMGIVSYIRKMKDIQINAMGAYSGEEALHVMQNFTPSILITDIQMPAMSGLELIARVRAKRLCSHFIVLTAHERFDYAQEAIRQHVDDYLVKPVDWAELERQIREYAMQPDRQAKLDLVMREYPGFFGEPDTAALSAPLRKIVRYMRASYAGDLSLAIVADYAGMSENYICSLFKKEMRMTFLDFVYRLRMRKAIELLLMESDRTVKEISAIVGYHSERQFFRMFRSVLNMTPQQFRDKHAAP